MRFRLVDNGWDKEMNDAALLSSASIHIVCPFIKKGAVAGMIKNLRPKELQVITRFNLDDFAAGASDISALKLILENGAQIRGIRNLHAKLYLFGLKRAIVTSANLTRAALSHNHELGFVSDDPVIVGECKEYFDSLWRRGGEDLRSKRLEEWEKKIAEHLAVGIRREGSRLGDEGTDIGIHSEPQPTPGVAEAEQGFVKFIGGSDSRANRALSVLEDLRRSTCHMVCGFPKGKRPRQVRDGAIMFMGRLVQDPNDIVIYGRAIGMHHEPGRDDATEREQRSHHWKVKYPHYIRVHHPEFVAGTLSNGVSLNELMESLKADSFMSTQRNAMSGKGNTKPRSAYTQKAAIELTPRAMDWINCRLQHAFLKHGTVPQAALAALVR